MPKTPKTKKPETRINVDDTPENANWLRQSPRAESISAPSSKTLPIDIKLSNGSQVRLVEGNLTRETVDAIVNAANEDLILGGGIAGNILKYGGQEIQDECDAWVRANGRASPTKPGVTGAGRLPAKMIIHAVAPRWLDGEHKEPQLLTSAYASSLDVANKLGLKSIAFPSLGTGNFHNPIEVGAQSARAAVEAWVRKNPTTSLKEIKFVLWGQDTVDVFQDVFQGLSG